MKRDAYEIAYTVHFVVGRGGDVRLDHQDHDFEDCPGWPSSVLFFEQPQHAGLDTRVDHVHQTVADLGRITEVLQVKVPLGQFLLDVANDDPGDRFSHSRT